MAKTLTDRHKKILELGAKDGILPSNVACKIGCVFCYEKYVKKDFNNLEFRAIPKYSEESFNYFMDHLDNNEKGILPTSVFEVDGDSFQMGPNADFFSLGLTVDQIDRIIGSHSEKYPFFIYTTGFDLSSDLMEYLTKKHGKKFVLRMSVITFDDTIKPKVVANWTKESDQRAIIKMADNPKIMLMCFTYEQLVRDITILNKLKPDGVNGLISIMHYTDSYPKEIKELADISFIDFPKVIAQLKRNPELMSNFTDIRFLHPPEAYAYKFRGLLKQKLQSVTRKDLILCSKATYTVLRAILSPSIQLYSIDNPAGGSMNFATTLTTNSVLNRITELQEEGINFERVFVPSSIWWAKGEFDMEASSFNSLKLNFPSLDFRKIEISNEIVNSSLSLNDVYNWLLWNKEIEIVHSREIA